jgi:hypothetical protein
VLEEKLKEKRTMGQGSYVICEWDSVQKDNRPFQLAMQKLEQTAVNKCLSDWKPKSFNVKSALSPDEGGFGRTTILPELFDDHSGTQMAHWRQSFTTAGHQTLITGTRSGNTIPEDFKVAWIGLALPNKQQHITEIKWQIGDRKYGRLNLEEVHSYNKPAIIFEEGLILDEETSFDLYGYVEGPIPDQAPFITSIFQRIVMLGAAYFKVTSKVLGNCGAAI